MSPFNLGDQVLWESEGGGVAVVTIVAVTQWLEGFQPSIEYIVCNGAKNENEFATLATVRPEQLTPLGRTA